MFSYHLYNLEIITDGGLTCVVETRSNIRFIYLSTLYSVLYISFDSFRIFQSFPEQKKYTDTGDDKRMTDECVISEWINDWISED